MFQDRTSEWFVPKFGSRNFRVTIGLLFLPYTSIVTCFAAWGSLSGSFETERLIAVCVIYFWHLGFQPICWTRLAERQSRGEICQRENSGLYRWLFWELHLQLECIMPSWIRLCCLR